MVDRRADRRWTRCGVAALLAALLTLASSALGAAGATPPHLLVPVGGGYSEASLAGFSKVVIQHAHGATVDILVVPSAYGDDPQQRKKNIDLAGQRAQQLAGACNAVVGGSPFAGCKATLLILFDRNDALTPANSAAFNDPETDGAFILGGDQDIAMEVLAESPAETAMASAFDRGVVFGGTSAGAAVESQLMIAGFTGSNGPENGFAQGSVDVWWANGPDSARRGLIFGSQNIIYDQHFYQRGRFARLLNVVAASDDQFGVSRLGVGVDYATGVATTDDATIASPFGASSAAIVDFETAGATHGWVGVMAPKILSARNVLTHIFAPNAA